MGLTFKAPCKFTLSANEIRQYSECSRKRYYASRDCLAIRPKRVSKNLSLGKAVHMALQYYYTKLNEALVSMAIFHPEADDVQALLDGLRDFVLPEDTKSTMDAASLQIYTIVTELYRKQLVEDLVKYEIIACELAFHMDDWPIPDVMYHGNIDMVVRDRETGKFWFFEHKTCTNYRPEIYNRFDIQLHIYDAYGEQNYGDDFGGMILNQVKKAKTEKGFGILRMDYSYDDDERAEFYTWLRKKTEGLTSSSNNHEPCNNYMGCKMCEFAPICMKFGYGKPSETKEVTENDFFKAEDGSKLFEYNPREEEEEEE